MPTVGLDGTRFYYEERGKGPALVIVPATGADTSMTAAAAGLLATTHRAITYDRRGFGRTAAAALPRAKHYLKRHVDDSAQLARELGAVPATFLGWSWGGLVALGAAIHHPSVVREVILYEPPLHERSPLRASAFGKIGFEKRAAKRFFESTIGTKTWKSLDERVRSELLANPKSVVAELAAGNGEELTTELLARVKVPVSVILDEDSAPTTLVRMYPRARVVRMDDASSMAIVRRPDVFVDRVRDCLRADA